MAIAVTVDGHVLRIEIDRPEVRNALDWEAYERLSAAWRRLATDNDLWLGVLTATGDKTFCAGADLSSVPAEIQRRATTDELPKFPPMEFNTSFCPKPIISAMNGDALGGGLELALACDFRIAGSHTRFSLPEVRFSGLPGAGGTQRLPRLIGIPRAVDMLVTGRVVGAIEAEAIGLVTKVVEREEVAAATAALEETLLTVGPLGVWGIKEAVFRGIETTLEEGLAIEQAVAARLMASEDFTHGVQAYRAKEKANWKGAMTDSFNPSILDVAEDGSVTLLASRCEVCSSLAFPQQSICPRCSGASFSVALPRDGEIYSQVEINEAVTIHPVPSTIVLVDMGEHVKAAGRLIGEPAPIGAQCRLVPLSVADREGVMKTAYAFEAVSHA